MDNAHTFSAIRGIQGGRDYYVAMAAPTVRNTEPVIRTSVDLPGERLAELHRLFPDVFVEGKVGTGGGSR